MPMQKPTITMSTVQPQAKLPPSTTTVVTTTTTTSHGHLPQLPPRVPSQPSTESLASISSPPPKQRVAPPPGPPPAIPPRTGAIARSGSVQVQQAATATRSFVRQASANSTPPQYMPQPPPPFVIPKRLARASTLTAASNSSCNSNRMHSSAPATAASPLRCSQCLRASLVPAMLQGHRLRPIASTDEGVPSLSSVQALAQQLLLVRTSVEEEEEVLRAVAEVAAVESEELEEAVAQRAKNRIHSRITDAIA
ncbi:MAP kinase-activating death domain protein-like [Drosophila nasuta]|uniref:MAP kinase-activating death domain protein-like n=1 Tax=Drosophila nasuta TaxID=42062 RepID=UPI00295EAA1C|nr:MAP kinase-activating death domain protein-like [Drosophila nasuta]